MPTSGSFSSEAVPGLNPATSMAHDASTAGTLPSGVYCPSRMEELRTTANEECPLSDAVRELGRTLWAIISITPVAGPVTPDEAKVMFMAEKDAVTAAVIVVGYWSKLAPAVLRSKGNITVRIINGSLRGHPALSESAQCRAVLDRCVAQNLFTTSPGPNGADIFTLTALGWSMLRAAESRWSAIDSAANRESTQEPWDPPQRAPPPQYDDDATAMFMAEEDAVTAAVIVVGCWPMLAPLVLCTKGNIINSVANDTLRDHPVITTGAFRAALDSGVTQKLFSVAHETHGRDLLSLSSSGWSELRAAERRWSAKRSPPRSVRPASLSAESAYFAATGVDIPAKELFLAAQDGFTAAVIAVGCWSELMPRGVACTRANVISRMRSAVGPEHPFGSKPKAIRAAMDRSVSAGFLESIPTQNNHGQYNLLSLAPLGSSLLQSTKTRALQDPVAANPLDPSQPTMLAQWIQHQEQQHQQQHQQRQPPQRPALLQPQDRPHHLEQQRLEELHNGPNPDPVVASGGASPVPSAPADVFSFFDVPAPPQPIEAAPAQQAMRPRIVQSAADTFFATARPPADAPTSAAL